MVVEEMNILTTVFLRFDNQKVVYPNSLLWTKSIGNYYRSPDMGDGIEFSIHIATPAEKIVLIKQRITRYIGITNIHKFYIYICTDYLHSLCQLHWGEEGSLVSSADDSIQRHGVIEQCEDCGLANASNESSRHGREMGSKISACWRDCQDLQRAWHWVSIVSSWHQYPYHAHFYCFACFRPFSTKLDCFCFWQQLKLQMKLFNIVWIKRFYFSFFLLPN